MKKRLGGRFKKRDFNHDLLSQTFSPKKSLVAVTFSFLECGHLGDLPWDYALFPFFIKEALDSN